MRVSFLAAREVMCEVWASGFLAFTFHGPILSTPLPARRLWLGNGAVVFSCQPSLESPSHHPVFSFHLFSPPPLSYGGLAVNECATKTPSLRPCQPASPHYNIPPPLALLCPHSLLGRMPLPVAQRLCTNTHHPMWCVSCFKCQACWLCWKCGFKIHL